MAEVRSGRPYRLAEGGRGAGVAVAERGGEVGDGLLEVLLLAQLPPQRLQALRHRRLVPRRGRHGARFPIRLGFQLSRLLPDLRSGGRWAARGFCVCMMRASPEV